MEMLVENIVIGVIIVAGLILGIYKFSKFSNEERKNYIKRKAGLYVANMISDMGLTVDDFSSKESIKKSELYKHIQEVHPLILATLNETEILDLIYEIASDMFHDIDCLSNGPKENEK